VGTLTRGHHHPILGMKLSWSGLRVVRKAVRSPWSDPPANSLEPRRLTNRVAVEAKRILLRYGAPIAVLDLVDDRTRIEMARAISKTPLAEREETLRALLTRGGYLTEP